MNPGFRKYNVQEMPQQPMVVVASLLCIGVALGWSVMVEWWLLLTVWVVLVGLYIYQRVWWMALVLMLYAGFSTTMLHRYVEGDLPREAIYMVEVEAGASEGVSRGVVRVVSYSDDLGESWRRWCGEIDYSVGEGAVDLEIGDRAVLSLRVWRFCGRYYTKLTPHTLLSLDRSERMGESCAERLNSWAALRIERLGLSEDSEAIVKAMLLGRREALRGELIEGYRRGGAAHILAVSGLHVVILFLVLGKVLLLLNIVPFGFRLRPIILAGLVWLYAAVIGFTPSVERAAIMFSVVQIMRLMGERYRSLSSLSLAVVVMVLLEPYIIFNVGFILSVVAVLSILVWVLPLEESVRRVCRERFGRDSVVGWIVSQFVVIFLIGIFCSMATMPLVSWAFGYISPISLLFNPVVVVTAYLLLTLSLLWVLFGVAALSPLFSFAIESIAGVQNGVVEYLSSGWRDALDIRINLLSVIAIYTLYVAASIVLLRGGDRQK